MRDKPYHYLNQDPGQLVRDKTDAALVQRGWIIQSKNQINLKVGLGIAVREYQTDIGPADYGRRKKST